MPKMNSWKLCAMHTTRMHSGDGHHDTRVCVCVLCCNMALCRHNARYEIKMKNLHLSRQGFRNKITTRVYSTLYSKRYALGRPSMSNCMFKNRSTERNSSSTTSIASIASIDRIDTHTHRRNRHEFAFVCCCFFLLFFIILMWMHKWHLL